MAHQCNSGLLTVRPMAHQCNSGLCVDRPTIFRAIMVYLLDIDHYCWILKKRLRVVRPKIRPSHNINENKHLRACYYDASYVVYKYDHCGHFDIKFKYLWTSEAKVGKIEVLLDPKVDVAHFEGSPQELGGKFGLCDSWTWYRSLWAETEVLKTSRSQDRKNWGCAWPKSGCGPFLGVPQWKWLVKIFLVGLDP